MGKRGGGIKEEEEEVRGLGRMEWRSWEIKGRVRSIPCYQISCYL